MIILYLLLAALGCLIVLRAIMQLFAAEMGRKQDLIKHIYKGGTDFQVAIVIPYLDSRKIRPFQALIQALEKQDYPAAHVGIHVVATEDTMFGLPASDELPSNVKVWTYPAKQARRGQLTAWLIERLLAAGGPSKLFVFLDADDIVRPDFLRNVTTRAFDCFAMQGYIALKRPPKGMFSYVVALSVRLVNRIENAGRFHLGLSCKLLNSGWVIRQELLEMIPFRQGQDMDNQEYSALLNLSGYRINWAPNAVVYKEERADFVTLMGDIANSLLNRIRLGLTYSPRLLIQGITRFDLSLLEQSWSLIKPPNFIVGLLGVVATIGLFQSPVFSGSFYYAAIFTLAFWSTQLISLAVARCNLRDIFVFAFATPFIYALGLILSPVFGVGAIGETLFKLSPQPKKARVGKRFDESVPPKSVQLPQFTTEKSQRLFSLTEMDGSFAEENTSDAFSTTLLPGLEGVETAREDHASTNFAAIYEEKLSVTESGVASPFSPESLFTKEPGKPTGSTRVTLPISNGRNSVDCTINTYTEHTSAGTEEYYLVFEYKNLSFTTRKYRLLDQAYYELQAKLQTKGFTIVSCGSCAYFYRPSADGGPIGSAKEHGFCLFGKQGKEINVATDAVTVISRSCEEHTPVEHRQAVVEQWQKSLEQVSLPQGF